MCASCLSLLEGMEEKPNLPPPPVENPRLKSEPLPFRRTPELEPKFERVHAGKD
jgi:hypothetical protein